MSARDILEAAGVVIMFLVSIITGASTFTLRGLRADVTRLLIDMEKKVSYDAFAKKSNFIHEKFNDITGEQGERIAVLEDRQGIKKRQRQVRKDNDE